MQKYFYLIFFFSWTLLSCGGSSSSDSSDDNNSSSTLTLTSTAIKESGSEHFKLPITYTCDGKNGGVSPTISWSNIPSGTVSFVITMHSGDTGSTTPHLTLFNIDSSVSTLEEDNLSIGTIAQGNGFDYNPPCEANATETTYTTTLFALSSDLNLTTTATQEDVISELQSVLLESTTQMTSRTRYDGMDNDDNSHVPTSVASTCATKTSHFDQISSVIKSVSCDEASNQMDVISHISDGLKTSEAQQQVQVGVSKWIGRLSLPSETGHSVKVNPDYLSGVNNNLKCDGDETLGITIDGQIILPYFKQSNSSGNTSTCGPTDGNDYATRDTIVLGEVDQCYGHSPNGEGYHLHGAPICLMDIADPSQPIAYMSDGIPLYFGEGGGTITTTAHAVTVGANATDLNYGSGYYEHLNYLPSDVNDGSNPLNECNAYDINNDGDTSGYVYYTTKDAPYTIGCYMGSALSAGNPGAENTRFNSFTTKEGENDHREGWEGQILGEAMEAVITSNTYGTFNNKTYNITEFDVSDAGLSFLDSGNTAQVLWRILDESDTDYVASTSCFEFRYRKDINDIANDETEIICSIDSIPSSTLDFTPFN